MSAMTSPHLAHQHRRPSNTSSSQRLERQHSLRSNGSSEGGRSSHSKLHERDRLQHTNRAYSEANLYTLHQAWGENPFDESQHRSERPPMTPRKLSQASKASFASLPAKSIDANPAHDVNIAVLGNASVGKTTFIQRTLDLDDDEVTQPPSRVLGVSGKLCTVRMFEMSLDEVYRGEENVLKWPQRIGSITVHGAITLYDVGNKSSFKLVPEVLNAVNKMGFSSVLAACKCDILVADRELEPRTIEQRATSAFDRITTLQTSETTSEPFRKAISAILKNVVSSTDSGDGNFAGPRPRNFSKISSVPSSPISPRRPPPPVHSRSTSEIPSSRRHDSLAISTSGKTGSSVASKSTSVSSYQHAGSSSSFLIDESPSDDTASQTSLSAQDTDASDDEAERENKTPQPHDEELGWTFDALVNRLLALPTSKADSKFAAVFLALYRKFAPPGRLLEGIVVRFEELDRTQPVMLTRTVSQLRYLTIVEQWIHSYPGDFAHPKTHRRIRTFISKLRRNSIFAAAAQEMDDSLRFVAEDDDTEWAYCDKTRKEEEALTASKWSYRGSLLIDDPDFEFPDQIGKLTLRTPGTSSADDDVPGVRQNSIKMEDLAQREASKLVPSYVYPVHKNAWRALVVTPADVIAKDMTRMDWIMFSSIRPRDLVRHVSLSQAQKSRCKSLANVSRMIDHFNYIRDWAINFIMFRDKPKHRAQMLEHFIAVGRKLRELNNYNSLGAILAAIHSTPVSRLEATLDLISAEANKDCMKLEILMSQTRSFSSYRLAWENSTGERIPYLPLPIRDLIGAESGNRTFATTAAATTKAGNNDCDRRINWRKFEVMGEVLVGIQRAQGVPYRLDTLGPRNDEVRLQILHARVERSDEALYTRSVALEKLGTGEKKGFMKDFFKR